MIKATLAIRAVGHVIKLRLIRMMLPTLKIIATRMNVLVRPCLRIESQLIYLSLLDESSKRLTEHRPNLTKQLKSSLAGVA